MFTGIVSDVGELLAIEPRAEGLVRFTIARSYAADSIDITRAFISDFNSKNPATASVTQP